MLVAETTTQSTARSTLLPMVIIGILFFIFGFVTWLNGSLIPFLRIVCELNEFQALFVTFAFYIAYTCLAIPAAQVLKISGYKNGMVIGLLIMAVGALVFIPAAKAQNYGIFLAALFLLGSGLTLLQTAANPYIVCIGPRESAAMRISIMGLVNKGAGVVVPLAFTSLMLHGIDQFTPEVLQSLDEAARQQQLAELASRLVVPYVCMAVVLIGLSGFVKFSSLSEPVLDDAPEEKTVANRWGILQHPQIILGAIALFFYVGVEVIAGDTIGLYGQGLGVSHYGSLTSYTMSFMVIGYLMGVAFIPNKLSQEKALLASALLGIVFVLGVMFASNESTLIADVLFGWAGIPVVPNTVMFLAMLGFANALVWPAIWPLALQDLGKYTATGSALLIMGIAGGALLPLAYGHFASGGNSQTAYWIMIPCYAFILFYALKGHKLRRW
ncbi:sugar MFS transporter [Teredinibacter turnerae]|uniref:sugar MFS transporter n=1 Tax=Teredinibacter turnerae TaxID=2426 RepID=UPI0003807FA3|nr:sugar MFS transporter [Teredinibacter turnerae]